MSNQNEIDDILNEIKSKRESENGDKKNNDILNSFTPPQKEKSKADDVFSNIKFDEKPTPKAADNHFDLISAPKNDFSNEIFTDDGGNKGSNNGRKKIIIITVAVILVIAIIAGAAFAIAKNKNKEPETTAAPSTTTTTTEAVAKIVNPLTGEEAYNEKAVGKRPVACVVENSYPARPQWGIDDNTNSPDIILEGEVEGGETRMLWFYADYTSLPDQIGPMRSARPPYIRFSELFDSIFIHWGQSSTRDNYIGADTVFRTDNVDHINQMTYGGSLALFGRDSSRGVSSEHTGVLYGDKLAQAITEAKFRTDIDKSSFTNLTFNEKEQAVSNTKCDSFSFTFSSRTKTRDWAYNADDKMYHCTDYLTDVARKNLLVLYDDTEYVTKYNYKGTGKSETYCDYKLAGGSGKLLSLGTITEIKWSVENGVLSVKDTNGKNISLNTGRTWIGYGSANNGGSDKNNTPSENTSEQN